ncbi:MAG: glutamate racemase [Bifidobacteriaceae bacterium]|nr:glutamate racemase [Bifidobacteriaceae bacterium]
MSRQISDERAIGVFDSGAGGLSVLNAIAKEMPAENIFYIGDEKHTPYGTKPISDVRKYSLDIMDSLLVRDIKAIVIACNTASVAVYYDALERYETERGIKVFEVIKPTVQKAILETRNGKIGVIGTDTTISSGVYADALTNTPRIEVFQQKCPEFVRLVEEGKTEGAETEQIATKYLSDLGESGIDTLILGCTHYPMLSAVIGRTINLHNANSPVKLISSADAVADKLKVYLQNANKQNLSTSRGKYDITSTEPSARFDGLVQKFLVKRVVKV